MNISNDILRALVHGPVSGENLFRKYGFIKVGRTEFGLLIGELCEHGLIVGHGDVFTITDIGRSELE